MRRDVFNESELVGVDASSCVVLNSGGPLMDVLSVVDSVALCEWREDDGRISRGRFSVNALSRLVPFIAPDGNQR